MTNILVHFPFFGMRLLVSLRAIRRSPIGSPAQSGSGRNTWRRNPIQTREGGSEPFPHPPSRKTPTPFLFKMFAVAAQTTVRATAQVKATKVAAKEQKSAYVHPRFPASFVSRRFSFFPGDRRGSHRARRGDDDDNARAAIARTCIVIQRVSLPRAQPAAMVARVSERRLRARRSREQRHRFLRLAAKIYVLSRGALTEPSSPEIVPPSTVPFPPRLPAPPPRCSCSRPPRRSRTASRCRMAPTRLPASTSSPSTIPARLWRWRRTLPRSSPPRVRASPPTSRRARRTARPSPARPASPPWTSTTSKQKTKTRAPTRAALRTDRRRARIGARSSEASVGSYDVDRATLSSSEQYIENHTRVAAPRRSIASSFFDSKRAFPGDRLRGARPLQERDDDGDVVPRPAGERLGPEPLGAHRRLLHRVQHQVARVGVGDDVP